MSTCVSEAMNSALNKKFPSGGYMAHRNLVRRRLLDPNYMNKDKINKVTRVYRSKPNFF